MKNDQTPRAIFKFSIIHSPFSIASGVRMAVKKGYKQSEVGVIPEDWDAYPVGDIVNYLKGFPFRAVDYKSHGVRILRVSDTTYDQIKEEGIYIDAFEAKRYRKWGLRGGDLVVSTVGSKPPMYDSMVGKVTFISEQHAGTLLNQNAVVLRSESRSRQRMIQYNLRQERYISHIKGIFRGNANQASITLRELFDFQIPLPPTLAEQEAIAGALSDADGWIESLEQLIAKKRQIKQGAMQELLTGKRRLPGFSGEWERKRLGEIVLTDPENLSTETNPDYVFNYISLEDVDHGRLKSHSQQVLRSAPSRARRKLKNNDVIISTVRPNLLSHLLFTIKHGEWVCSTGFCVIRCLPGRSHPYFVLSQFFAESITQQIETLLTGSNYPSINSSDVKSLQILHPEYIEQTAIATVLSDMDAEIDFLESKLAKAREIKQGMMQELLTGRIRLVKSSAVSPKHQEMSNDR